MQSLFWSFDDNNVLDLLDLLPMIGNEKLLCDAGDSMIDEAKLVDDEFANLSSRKV